MSLAAIKRLSALALVLVGHFTTALGSDMSNLYSNSTLEYWQGRYSENILWNYRNAIWRELSPDEKHRLHGVEISFPLVGRHGNPFDYFTALGPTTSRVHLPVLSIKFFDDLAVAHSWLAANGLDLQIVPHYIVLLKYLKPADFPGGRYQPPRRALRIPSNATEKPIVEDTSQKILKSAITWILLHELGHAYYRHGDLSSRMTAQQKEMQADEFATEVMRRVGIAPIGIGFYFTAQVLWGLNRWDCPSRTVWHNAIRRSSHPTTPDRLRNLAARINQYSGDFVRKEPNSAAALVAVHSAADTLDQLASFLDNEEFQLTIVLTAKNIGALPDPLAHRRPGQLPAAPSTSIVRVPDLIQYRCPP